MRIFRALLIAIPVGLSCGASVQAQSSAVELAALEDGNPIRVLVEASCDGPDPVFRLVNEAADWPRLTKIEIIRLADEATIVDRNMRMKSGQRAKFKIPTQRIGEGAYGIRFLPSWYDREVELDASASCN